MKNQGDVHSYSISLEARAPLMAQLALALDGQWFLKVYSFQELFRASYFFFIQVRVYFFIRYKNRIGKGH
jgi:hypothetical protein